MSVTQAEQKIFEDVAEGYLRKGKSPREAEQLMMTFCHVDVEMARHIVETVYIRLRGQGVQVKRYEF